MAMRKYIVPLNTVVQLDNDDDMMAPTSIVEIEGDEQDVKGERDFYDDSPSVPSRGGSIWDNEW